MSMILLISILLIVYFTLVIGVIKFHENLDPKITNIIFIVLIAGFFLCLNIYYYDKGEDYHFMTFDNISPFTFTTIGFSYLLSKKVREYYFSMIAFLYVGMFIAMHANILKAELGFSHIASRDYAYDALSHLFVSVFAVYLVLSNQVKINMKNYSKALICVYSIVTFGVIRNFMFGKASFGMDPTGDYNIYSLRLFNNFWVTLFAYYIGILFVVSIGYTLLGMTKFLLRKDKEVTFKQFLEIEKN